MTNELSASVFSMAFADHSPEFIRNCFRYLLLMAPGANQNPPSMMWLDPTIVLGPATFAPTWVPNRAGHGIWVEPDARKSGSALKILSKDQLVIHVPLSSMDGYPATLLRIAQAAMGLFRFGLAKL